MTLKASLNRPEKKINFAHSKLRNLGVQYKWITRLKKLLGFASKEYSQLPVIVMFVNIGQGSLFSTVVIAL